MILGAIAPTVRVPTVPLPDETAVVAAVVSGPSLARAAIAAWDAGEAILPVNPQLPAAEVLRLLERTKPTHVIGGDGRSARPDGVPVPADTAAVMITSGTAGEPKAVELTRTGMETMARGYSAGVGAGPGDNWLACMPLHHVASLGVLARAYVTGIAWTVHESFDVDLVAQAPRVSDATIVSLVPTALRRLLDHGAPLDQFRCVIVGGAPCPESLRARAEAVGVNVVDAYGLTETWGGFALDGRPIEGVDVRLDPATSEILVRGAVVMRGYRDDPDQAASVLGERGWLRTGDIGAIVDERVRVIDRLKDLVITGGVNVSPTAVESVLALHPAISDVCVIGAADREWGERVVACIVPRDGVQAPTLDDVREFGRVSLSAPQLPRELRIVTAIPRSASGKPLRRMLRS
jgi:O-succinylbenzoic acid--CoA ligase